MIMAISASATRGHIRKEQTADWILWAQILVPKGPSNPGRVVRLLLALFIFQY